MSHRFQIWLSDAQWEAIKTAAARRGVIPTKWVRWRLFDPAYAKKLKVKKRKRKQVLRKKAAPKRKRRAWDAPGAIAGAAVVPQVSGFESPAVAVESWQVVIDRMKEMEPGAAADLFVSETQRVRSWPRNFANWSEHAKVRFLNKEYPRV